VDNGFCASDLLSFETKVLEEARSAQKQRQQGCGEASPYEIVQAQLAMQEAGVVRAVPAAASSPRPRLLPPQSPATASPSTSPPASSATPGAAAAAATATAATSPGDEDEGAASVRFVDMSGLRIDEDTFGKALPAVLPPNSRDSRSSSASRANDEDGSDDDSQDYISAAADSADGAAAHQSPLVARQAISSFDYCRALISRLYVGLEQLPTVAQTAASSLASFGAPPAPALPARQPSLVCLEDTVKLRRSLKLLDANPCRECHKIGVIYCGGAQDSQRALLSNEGGSTLYERFLERLGARISVAGHTGFLGGLDARSTGPHSRYWSSSSIEVQWHVVSMMPSRSQEADEQQIHKKRQVGNDHVHVVWSEYGREYRPSVISSQFNDAHIVVYPMRTPAASNGGSGSNGDSATLGSLPSTLHGGLYRISVFSKASVPPFGPLQDGMVVRGELLPALVRLTALNANRAIRYSTAGYGRPYPTRRKYINDILAKHMPVGATHAGAAGGPSTAALSSLIMPMMAQA
jgi:hypothetical protein